MAEVDGTSPAESDLDEDDGFKSPIQISKTDDEDTLVDVHVNNPLKKITEILEEIKKQKAFSFTLKGSLGIAGVALVITSFGIFGGTQAFCNRGTQTALGSIMILQVANVPQESLPLLDTVKRFLFKETPTPKQRVVLISSDNVIIHLKQVTPEEVKKINQKSALVTGQFDSCSQELTVTEPNAIQVYP